VTAGMPTTGWLPAACDPMYTHLVLSGADTVAYEAGVAYVAVCGARCITCYPHHPWASLPHCRSCTTSPRPERQARTTRKAAP